MKKDIIRILDSYLKIFPNEKSRLESFFLFLNNSSDFEITDCNNFIGHIVASVFVYSTVLKKFLVLYHKDLKMYLYPGGYINKTDNSILDAAIREVNEETGLVELKELSFTSNPMVPLDIDVQEIPYNERLNLPKHLHYDFRYLFLIEKISSVSIDESEMGEYTWISLEEMESKGFGIVMDKIKTILNEKNYL